MGNKKDQILVTSKQITDSIESIADRLNTDFKDDEVILLCIVKGGIIFAGQLLTRLNFKVNLDYVHATRYDGQVGGDIHWQYFPDIKMHDKNVLIVDDILDRGITLKAVIDRCVAQGASNIKSVVLLEKNIDRSESKIMAADYAGVHIEDEFVYGFGLDLDGYCRNLDCIYKVSNINE